jgi:hypothetical protein
LPTLLATLARYSGDDPTVRVVTGEIPVRFVRFLPIYVDGDTYAGNCPGSIRDYPSRSAAWHSPGTGRGRLLFQ